MAGESKESNYGRLSIIVGSKCCMEGQCAVEYRKRKRFCMMSPGMPPPWSLMRTDADVKFKWTRVLHDGLGVGDDAPDG